MKYYTENDRESAIGSVTCDLDLPGLVEPPVKTSGRRPTPTYFSIHHIERFIHYKDRNAPWVKMPQRFILEDEGFLQLTEVDQWRFMKLVLIAARGGNRVLNDQTYLRRVLQVDGYIDLTPLFHVGLLLASPSHRPTNPPPSPPLPPLSSPDLSSSSSLNPNLTLNLNLKKEQEVDPGLNNFAANRKNFAAKEEFDEFWEAYPKRNGKKIGKGRAAELFTALSAEDRRLCIQAARHYAQSERAQNGFVRDADRFIRAQYWREWIEPETRQIRPPKPPRETYHSKLMEKIAELQAVQCG